MSEQFLNKKICVMGIQGSGKTFFSKALARTHYKKCYWYLVNLDDKSDMPKKVKVIEPKDKSKEELEKTIKAVIEMGKRKTMDCIVIDEADLWLRDNRDIEEHMNDLIINHRHYNLTVIFITRRPQDIPTKIIESCEHNFIFALPKSDNIKRKMGSLHEDLVPMMSSLSVDKHNFIHLRLGHDPILKKKI